MAKKTQSQVGKMSKRKGNSFENNTAKLIRETFLPGIDSKVAYQLVHRTPMSGGHVERGDLIMKPPVWQSFPWFIECRNRENWAWKQIWEKGQESIILKWFIEDAHQKCHPYDHSEHYERYPLLLFTQNNKRVYFVAWEFDMEEFFYDLMAEGHDVTDVVNPYMRVWIDNVDNSHPAGYVVIGEFNQFLKAHTVPDENTIARVVNEYLGVKDEEGSDPS